MGKNGASVVEEEVDMDEEFPWLDEVVPSRWILPGKVWLYAQAANFEHFKQEGWSMVPGVDLFGVDGTMYMVMSNGEGTLGSVSFNPEVLVDTKGAQA